MTEYVKLNDVIKAIDDPHNACPHEGCSNCECAKYDNLCEVIYIVKTLPTKEIAFVDDKSNLEYINKVLYDWTNTINTCLTEDGVTFNKFGANTLLKDLNYIWDAVDRILENEDEAKPKRKPVRVCTMPSQGVWCNECTQFFNCDILCGKADKQVIYEEVVEDEY